MSLRHHSLWTHCNNRMNVSQYYSNQQWSHDYNALYYVILYWTVLCCIVCISHIPIKNSNEKWRLYLKTWKKEEKDIGK